MVYFAEEARRRYKKRKLKKILDDLDRSLLIGDEVLGQVYCAIALSVRGTDSPSYLLQRAKQYGVGYLSHKTIEEAEKCFQEECRAGLYSLFYYLRENSLAELKEEYNPLLAVGKEFSPGTLESCLGELINADTEERPPPYTAIGKALRQGAEKFYQRSRDTPQILPTHEEYEAVLEELVKIKI